MILDLQIVKPSLQTATIDYRHEVSYTATLIPLKFTLYYILLFQWSGLRYLINYVHFLQLVTCDDQIYIIILTE